MNGRNRKATRLYLFSIDGKRVLVGSHYVYTLLDGDVLIPTRAINPNIVNTLVERNQRNLVANKCYKYLGKSYLMNTSINNIDINRKDTHIEITDPRHLPDLQLEIRVN